MLYPQLLFQQKSDHKLLFAPHQSNDPQKDCKVPNGLKSHRIYHNGCETSAQAYTIEVPTHGIPQLIPILKEATHATKEFVTFQMFLHTNPDAF